MGTRFALSSLAGAVFGAAIRGARTGRFGRRSAIILAGIIFTISAIGTAQAPGVSWLFAARIISGIGIASFNSPSYVAIGGLVIYVACFAFGLGPIFWLLISEIRPLKIRGAAMSAVTVTNCVMNLAVAVTRTASKRRSIHLPDQIHQPLRLGIAVPFRHQPGPDRSDDRELPNGFAVEVDARLPVHRHRFAPRRVCRRLAIGAGKVIRRKSRPLHGIASKTIENWVPD